MKITNVFLISAVILSIGGLQMSQPPTVAHAATVYNGYGYQEASPVLDSGYIDINHAGTVGDMKDTLCANPYAPGQVLDESREGYAGLSLGFTDSFPFFGKRYANAFIGVNGLIVFDPDDDITMPPVTEPSDRRDQYDRKFREQNNVIPSEILPNGYIAPLWYQGLRFNCTSSHLYYQMQHDDFLNLDYLVIEWKAIEIDDFPETLSFEVILTENGDIDFRYWLITINTVYATVGIEDSTGADGAMFGSELQLLSGMGGYPLHYSYPLISDTRRSVEVGPHTQGGFTNNFKAEFPLWIKNTSGLINSYKISVTAINGGAGWTKKLYRANDLNRVDEITSDIAIPLIAGDKLDLILVVEAPVSPPGPFAKLQVEAAAVPGGGDVNSWKHSAIVQVAVPAPFTQAFYDSTAGGMKLQFTRTHGIEYTTAVDYLSDNTMALNHTTSYEYVSTWGRDINTIEFTQSTGLGNRSNTVNTLVNTTDDIDPGSQVNSPTLAINHDDKLIGLVFIHQSANSVQNLHFSVANLYNTIKVDDVAVTNTQTAFPGIELNQPSISPFGETGFVTAWHERHTPADLGTNPDAFTKEDIYLRAYSSAGGATSNIIKVTNSRAESISGNINDYRYSQPSLTPLDDNHVLLTYTEERKARTAGALGVYRIAYRILDSTSGTPFPVADADPGTGVSMTLSLPTYTVSTLVMGKQAVATYESKSGNTFIAWINPESKIVNYGLYSDLTNPGSATIRDLEISMKLPTQYISATTDQYGNTILSWGDERQNYLYYALVNSSGGIETPAMVFRRGANPDYPAIIISQTGKGIAPMPDIIITRSYMPFSFR